MYTLYLYTEDQHLKDLYKQKALSQVHGDAGIDLFVPDEVSIETKHRGMIFLDHRIICRMTKTVDNQEIPVSYYLYPRSSISKTPLRLANSVGIIDSGYRGSIIAALDLKGNEYTVEKHTRLVQLCSPTLDLIRLVVCDSLSEMDMQTQRGSGGFGSTGK